MKIHLVVIRISVGAGDVLNHVQCVVVEIYVIFLIAVWTGFDCNYKSVRAL